MVDAARGRFFSTEEDRVDAVHRVLEEHGVLRAVADEDGRDGLCDDGRADEERAGARLPLRPFDERVEVRDHRLPDLAHVVRHRPIPPRIARRRIVARPATQPALLALDGLDASRICHPGGLARQYPWASGRPHLSA